MLGGGILKLSLAASALIFSQGLIAEELPPPSENSQLEKSKEISLQDTGSSPSNPAGTEADKQTPPAETDKGTETDKENGKDEAAKPTEPDVSTPVVPEKTPEEVKKEQLIKQTEEIVKNLGNLGNMAKDAVSKLVTILVDSGVKDLATFDANKLDATTKAKVQTAANAVATKVIDNEKSNITSNALGAFNVQINNMNKRLGEIRGLNGDIGTWFRAYGGRFSDSSNHINFYSTQFGADKMTNLSDADVITGAMIGFDKVNADTKAKGFNIGVYGSYIHNNGLFVDSVLKYANTSFKKTGVEFKKQNSVLLSVEGGYRAKINEKAYVEPSLEIITGRVGKYEAKSKANTISVKSFTPIMIKPQVYTGIEHKDFVFRAGVGAVVNAKKQEADIVINNIVNGIDAKAKTKLNSNNHGFASVGGSYKVNDNLRINLGVEKSFGSKFKKDYEVNAVIRYTF